MTSDLVRALPTRIRAGTAGTTTAVVSELDGRRVVLADAPAGSVVRAADATTLAAAARLARAEQLPLVGVLGTGAADIAEGMAALHAWGSAARELVACSGVVPTLIVIDGPVLAGPALVLGLADLIVMTEDAYAFINGPASIASFTGVEVDRIELGGSAVHARHTGAASIVVADRDAALAAVADVLRYLPDSCDRLGAPIPTDDDPARPTPEAGALLPVTSTGSYDVRDLLRALVDDGDLLELRARFAGNVVTGLAALGGTPIGIVANQPQALAGTLDIPASQKAARFVAWCDAFNLPVLTVVDTPGFYPGKDLEWRGMIRHGAQLVLAYARATVPRLCLVTRKSYGGAYIVLDSKEMGNDVCLAWPTAELAVMGAGQAAAILQRRATPEERAAFEADYTARLLNPYVAAERGLIDGVVEPAGTRAALCAALAAIGTKRERLPGRKHDNGPL